MITIASKRQKKKNQKKNQSKQLGNIGISEKKAKGIIRDHKVEEVIREHERAKAEAKAQRDRQLKELKKLQRNEKLQSRREALRNAGYSNAEIQKLQHRGEKALEELIRARQEWYMVVGYKDVSEETDGEALYKMKEYSKRRTKKQLINSILGWLEAGSQGYIGGYRIDITNDLNSTYRLIGSQGYLVAYHGQGKYLQRLLALIDNMMFLVYRIDQKDEFIQELVENLRYLPYPEAHENADFIEKEFLKETAEHF